MRFRCDGRMGLKHVFQCFYHTLHPLLTHLFVILSATATNRRAVGIEAGIDLEMPGTFGIHRSLIKAALKDGSLTQNRFDEAVLRNIKLIQRASKAEKNGDNTGGNKLPDQPEELYEQNHELAYQTALECVVLLQNEGNI